jgi:HPt (histidine-containing phosphotransfer) domain-containing protein
MKNETDKPFSLDELRQLSNGDEKFVQEMINIFVRTTTEGMDEIEKAFNMNNYNAIAEYTHKLSPPCRHMGADELYKTFKSIEDRIRKSDGLNKLDVLVAKARTETDKVIKELKKEISDPKLS